MYALANTEYDTLLNREALNEVTEYFTGIRDQYLKSGLLNPKALGTNPNILKYLVPGGMLSNLMNQLEKQNAFDKYEEVLKEVPRVRKDLGYPPLVTPISQMVGTQAVMNVMTKERYKVIPSEIKDYVKGLYGKSPLPISDEIRTMIIGDAKVIDYRPADDLKPMFQEIKKKYSSIASSDEDLLSCALFPQTAVDFLERKNKMVLLKEKDEIIEFNLITD
jgi:oxaloacetate decarboxylase alpha subunit